MCWQSYVARSSSTASPGASGQAFHCHPQEIIANTRIHLFMLHLDYLTLFNVVTYQWCLTLQLHFLSDRARQNWACTSLDSSTHIWFFFSPQILPVCSYSLQYLIWFCLGPKVNYWLKKRDLYGTVGLRLFFFFLVASIALILWTALCASSFPCMTGPTEWLPHDSARNCL